MRRYSGDQENCCYDCYCVWFDDNPNASETTKRWFWGQDKQMQERSWNLIWDHNCEISDTLCSLGFTMIFSRQMGVDRHNQRTTACGAIWSSSGCPCRGVGPDLKVPSNSNNSIRVLLWKDEGAHTGRGNVFWINASRELRCAAEHFGQQKEFQALDFSWNQTKYSINSL